MKIKTIVTITHHYNCKKNLSQIQVTREKIQSQIQVARNHIIISP